MQRETLTLNKNKAAEQKITGLETERRTDGESGGPGNQNDARLAMMESLADSTDKIREHELNDVTTEDYDDAPGTSAEPVAASDASDTEEQSESAQAVQAGGGDGKEDSSHQEPRKFKIKVNGVEQELTEDELIARAQKISAADGYLAEAIKLQQEAAADREKAKLPSQEDVQAAVKKDYRALARALQMGSEDEAADVLQSLDNSQRTPSNDELLRTVDTRLDQRLSLQRDLAKFNEEYKELLSDPKAKALVEDLDEGYNLKGERASYDRFKKAADKVQEIFGVKQANTSFADKEQRKASVRTVTGASTRQAAPAEEKEPSTSDIIANMAKSRGQFVSSAGN